MPTPSTHAAFDSTGTGGEAAPATHAAHRPMAVPQPWISHALRRLEPWVAWSICACTAWVAAVAFPGVPLIWLFVLYAGLIGKWAQVHPSRLQAGMFLRGAALVAGAYVLHTQAGAEVGGPAGPFFFWLSITALYYAFMLRPPWAVGLVGLALVEFVAAALQTGHGDAATTLLAQGGFLFIFPLVLALKFGAVMRRPDEALEQDRVDARTALYNQRGLLACGADMLQASQRDHRPLCMVLLNCADLLEVRSIYGNRIGRKLLARIVRKLNLIAGERGLAARTGPAQFALLLPGLTHDKALLAVQRVLGSPSCIELDAGGSEIMLVPDLALQMAGPTTASVEQMYAQLCHELAVRRENETRHLRHIARERERHSRPMGLAAVPERPARRPVVVVVPTMPVPMPALE